MHGLKLKPGFTAYMRSRLTEVLQFMLGNKDAAKIAAGNQKPVPNMESLMAGNTSSQNSSNGIS